MNPYVFIVGCPRSGTTLLRRMVDAHPMIAIPTSEQHWVPKWFERRNGVMEDGRVGPGLVSELLSYRKFAKTGLEREDLERLIPDGDPPDYASFVSGVFDLYAGARGKPLAGDKTPGHVRRIPTLHSLFPKAKFVHLIRDGRDVCLSVMGWDRSAKLAFRFSTWEEDPITTTALWWESMVRAGIEHGRGLGPDLYHEIRYEALVADAREECGALCDFLDVPYDDAMTRFHEGKTKAHPGLSAKKAWLPVTPGLRDWHSGMGKVDLERFEAAAGELLDELDYQRAVPEPSEAAMEHAARIRESFERDQGG